MRAQAMMQAEGVAWPSQSPHAVVIDRCAFARAALVAILDVAGESEVMALPSGEAFLRQPLAGRVRPVSVLVYRLPDALDALLAGLDFIADFLSSCGGNAVQVCSRVILLTDLPAGWLHDTLRASLASPERLLTLFVLPSKARPAQVRSVLSGRRAECLLVRQQAVDRQYAPRRGLTAMELRVLRDWLSSGIALPEQARLLGRSISTLYAHRLSAMRKLGCHTVAALVHWRGAVDLPGSKTRSSGGQYHV